MKIVDIASTIYINLGSPTDTTIPVIAFWLRSKVGDLNNLLGESFVLSAGYEITSADGTEISSDVVAILEKMYNVHKVNLEVRANMNSLSSDTILEVSDQGSSVKKINRNEVSKTLILLRKDLQTELKDLVTGYKSSQATPRQVVGDDEQAGYYPSSTYYTNRYGSTL